MYCVVLSTYSVVLFFCPAMSMKSTRGCGRLGAASLALEACLSSRLEKRDATSNALHKQAAETKRARKTA